MTDEAYRPEPNRTQVSSTGGSDETKEVSHLRRRLELLNAYLRDEIKSEHNHEEIIGKGPALRAVLDKVRLVAGTDTTVFIQGEFGTGKELIARAIHAASKRKDQPFIKVDCATLPSDREEEFLFGEDSEKYTELHESSIGRFSLADGGTIFLDEVSDLSLESQARVLRVLQAREFERVSGNSTIRGDVRVVAATSHDLRKAVKERSYREDLFQRLNVLPIQIPPLRDRREDIPLLANYLLAKLAARVGKRFETISPNTLKQLVAYTWPGNVRELANVIERAVVLFPGPMLEISPETLTLTGAAIIVPPTAPEPLDLATLERNHIRTVLERTRWVIDGPHGAAKVLGLHPNTLRSRLKKLGIQRAMHGPS